MKKFSRFLKLVTAMIVSAIVLFSCVDDDFDAPPIEQIPTGNVVTIEYAKTLFNDSAQFLNTGTEDAYLFDYDASIYGTVTMDNETDNSYRTFFIQDNTGGIAVFQAEAGGVYIGDSVRIYLRDLVVMQYANLFQLNAENGDGVNVDYNVVKQGFNVPRTPEAATIEEITNNKAYYQGRLVKLTDVQFVDTDTAETFASPEILKTENRYLQDSLDNQLIVRTSGYANFAGANVPNGSGSIIAIVSQFNSDMQLIIRRLNEVQMDNSRLDISTGGGGTPTGTGTFEDPYNVAGGITYQGQNDVWVEGYIVGVYETNVDPFAPSFTDPFNTNSNLIISDNETETDIDNCVIVQLPAGDIRTALNLVDNSGNQGKLVKVLGNLTTYFGDEGLKNTSGYWMDGTGVLPETGFYEEDFTSDLGTYTSFSVSGSQVWGWDSYDSGCAKMSGYEGSNNANEDWLVSGQIDLSTKTNVTLVIREAINYITSYSDMQVLVSTDYDGTSDPSTQGTWTELTGFNRPAGSSWDFVSSGDIDMSAYDGETNFFIAFKYTSTTGGAATWEVGNVLLKEAAK